MVNRSNNNANPNGGVAYVNSNNAPSNTNANIGSRLANRKENFNAVVTDKISRRMMKKVPDNAHRVCTTSRSLSSLTTPSTA